MKHWFLVWLFFCGCGGSLLAQDWRISGSVRGQEGEALPGASLLLNDSLRLKVDSLGQFRYQSKIRPKTLTIRHLGYFPQRIRLDTMGRNIRLDIRLISNDVSLPEVSISGKAIEHIFEEDFKTSLLDYDFAGRNLLFLVKDGKKTRLQITDNNGAILHELLLPDGQATFLHMSCIGNIHAVGADWAWEISFPEQGLDTFPRYPAEQFHQLIEPCVAAQNGVFAFQKIGPYRQSVQYYYVDSEKNRRLIAIIKDEKAESLLLAQHRAILQAYMQTIPDIDKDEIFTNTSALTDPTKVLDPNVYIRMAETNGLVAAIGNFINLANDSLYAPMVKCGPYLYLLDHINDRMIRYSDLPFEDGALDMNYHRSGQFKKQVLVDAASQRLYGCFKGKYNTLIIKEIDQETATATKTYQLSLAPYLSDHFKIRNGTLYFIGQPDVNTPNKRLYKMNIFKFKE